MGAVDDVVAAIRAGEPVLLPTDTVYGLCADPHRFGPAEQLHRLKGRPVGVPVALLAADLERLLERVPELRGRSAAVARALLPGPYTVVLPNPARRFGWLTGERPEAIGVRIPVLAGDAAEVLRQVGVVAATSANAHGAPDPRRLEDVPAGIRARCGAELDAGELLGIPSTVLDLTGPEPRVLREGAVPAAEALRRLAEVRGSGGALQV